MRQLDLKKDREFLGQRILSLKTRGLWTILWGPTPEVLWSPEAGPSTSPLKANWYGISEEGVELHPPRSRLDISWMSFSLIRYWFLGRMKSLITWVDWIQIGWNMLQHGLVIHRTDVGWFWLRIHINSHSRRPILKPSGITMGYYGAMSH